MTIKHENKSVIIVVSSSEVNIAHEFDLSLGVSRTKFAATDSVIDRYLGFRQNSGELRQIFQEAHNLT